MDNENYVLIYRINKYNFEISNNYFLGDKIQIIIVNWLSSSIKSFNVAYNMPNEYNYTVISRSKLLKYFKSKERIVFVRYNPVDLYKYDNFIDEIDNPNIYYDRNYKLNHHKIYSFVVSEKDTSDLPDNVQELIMQIEEGEFFVDLRKYIHLKMVFVIIWKRQSINNRFHVENGIHEIEEEHYINKFSLPYGCLLRLNKYPYDVLNKIEATEVKNVGFHLTNS